MSAFQDQLGLDLTNVFFKTGIKSEWVEEGWVYRPFLSSDGSGDYPIAVIPDATTEEIQPQGKGGGRVQSQYIRVLVKEADVIDGIQVNDRILGRSKVFKIVQVGSDGVGTVTLILHEET
jgi:hypothetical protein